MTSPIFAAAAAQYRQCRREYGDYLEGVFSMAHEVCNGVLLNAKGKAKGIDPFTLFSGTETRALCYASAELIEWWIEHPRLTFSAWERQWFQQPEEYQIPEGWTPLDIQSL